MKGLPELSGNGSVVTRCWRRSQSPLRGARIRVVLAGERAPTLLKISRQIEGVTPAQSGHQRRQKRIASHGTDWGRDPYRQRTEDFTPATSIRGTIFKPKAVAALSLANRRLWPWTLGPYSSRYRLIRFVCTLDFEGPAGRPPGRPPWKTSPKRCRSARAFVCRCLAL